MPEHDQAQICINGHLVNGLSKTAPALNKDFCGRCGAKTVTECPACFVPIPGFLVSESGSVEEVPPDEFCHKCGKSFPWRGKVKNKAAAQQEDRTLFDIWRQKLLNNWLVASLALVLMTLGGFAAVWKDLPDDWKQMVVPKQSDKKNTGKTLVATNNPPPATAQKNQPVNQSENAKAVKESAPAKVPPKNQSVKSSESPVAAKEHAPIRSAPKDQSIKPSNNAATAKENSSIKSAPPPSIQIAATAPHPVPANGPNPLAGNYGARNGNVVTIGDQNNDFDIFIDFPSGRHLHFKSEWIDFGQSFVYKDTHGKRWVCNVDATNRDIIHNESTAVDYIRDRSLKHIPGTAVGKENAPTKTTQPASTPSEASGASQTSGNPLAGTYHANNGNVVKIGNQIDNFDIVFEFPSGRRVLFQSTWINNGRSFWYKDAHGKRDECDVDASDGDVIHNLGTGVTYTRVR